MLVDRFVEIGFSMGGGGEDFLLSIVSAVILSFMPRGLWGGGGPVVDLDNDRSSIFRENRVICHMHGASCFTVCGGSLVGLDDD